MIASSLLKLKRTKEACIELDKAISLGSEIAPRIKKIYCKP
ncbi:hypothetical protein [Polaribacter aestuariivivens]